MKKTFQSREYGRKEAEWWTKHNADNADRGYQVASLEHMLSIAWKKGFESGQRNQKKLQAAKEKHPMCSDHPDAPHGFARDASHTLGRYVCECEGWTP